MNKIKEAMHLIDEEVKWCKENPDAKLSEGYIQGFIMGLGQAKYLVQKLLFIEGE